MIGGFIVEGWNEAWPGGGPFGLVGWQAAFMAVGIPGLLLAAWVAMLKEPVRGLVDGVPTEPSPTPFKGFFEELYAIIPPFRSEEHTSELQSLMRISYAVFCLKKKNNHQT